MKFFYVATIITFHKFYLLKMTKNEVEEELPLKATRSIDINTNEGTWISLDVHPGGERYFDLLGDIYELSIEGGKANLITEGLAFDSQPNILLMEIQYSFYQIEVVETMFG